MTLAALILCPIAATDASTLCGAEQPKSAPYVYDGDYLREGEIVYRLTLDGMDRSFDAPEINGKCEREKVLAKLSRDRLRELISDGYRVKPNGETTPARGGGKRIVAMVYVNGENVGTTLIREGLAVETYRADGFRGGEWCEG